MILFDTLVSYAFQRKQKNDLALLREHIGPDALLIIDSGAFTAHSTGEAITVEDYAKFLDKWKGTYDAAVTLDVIGDGAATALNTQKLRDMGHDVLPVHTGAASLDNFDALCESSDWVCLGGIVGVRQHDMRRKFVGGLVQHAQRRGVAVHSLGTGSRRIVRSASPFSYDVSTASRALLHGGVPLYVKSKGRIETFRAKDPPETLRKFALDFADHGVRVSSLLEGTLFNTKETRLYVVRAAIAGAVAFAHDMRLKAATPPPERLAGRSPGPRVCTALVTNECVEAMMQMVKGGVPIDPPRIIRQRMEQ